MGTSGDVVEGGVLTLGSQPVGWEWRGSGVGGALGQASLLAALQGALFPHPHHDYTGDLSGPNELQALHQAPSS